MSTDVCVQAVHVARSARLALRDGNLPWAVRDIMQARLLVGIALGAGRPAGYPFRRSDRASRVCSLVLGEVCAAVDALARMTDTSVRGGT